MSRTIVRRALEQDECVVWDPRAVTSTSSTAAGGLPAVTDWPSTCSGMEEVVIQRPVAWCSAVINPCSSATCHCSKLSLAGESVSVTVAIVMCRD